MHLDGADFVIVGVLPRSFHFQPRRGDEPDLVIPLEPDADRGRFELSVVARLLSGVTREQAQAEVDRIAVRIAGQNPEVDRRQGFRLIPLHQAVTQGTKKTALVLFGAVVFLLLIACANVANLLVARGVGREREIAIRLAIGASRQRLLRQMLTESGVLALLGGGLGLLLAYGALPLLAAIAPAQTSFLNRIQDNGITVNGAVLAFTVAISATAAVLFGILPAVRSTRPMPSSAATGWASSSGAGRTRSAGALVAIEVALSFVLLAGAGLMVTTLWRLLAVDPGFRTERLLTMSVSLPEARYPDGASQSAYVTQALDRLRRLPGVRSAAATSLLPMRRESWSIPFDVDGPRPLSGQASFHTVSAAYFETMGIPVLRGRSFTEADRAGAVPVAIVSRRMEQRYWPGGSAIGRTLTVDGPTPPADTTAPSAARLHLEIVGVVGNVRQLGLDDDPRAEFFTPAAQWGVGNKFNGMTFVLRTMGVPTAALANRAVDEMHTVDADQPITDVKTMDELIAADTASPRFVLVLIGLFALTAIVLAAFGIYGVVSHTVARRTGEVAVRLALGARPAEVVGLVARQHLAWVAGGVVAGVLGALALTRLLASQLFGVQPIDIPTYAAAAALLALVAIVAAVVPASRAARVEPAAVLRNL